MLVSWLNADYSHKINDKESNNSFCKTNRLVPAAGTAKCSKHAHLLTVTPWCLCSLRRTFPGVWVSESKVFHSEWNSPQKNASKSLHTNYKLPVCDGFFKVWEVWHIMTEQEYVRSVWWVRVNVLECCNPCFQRFYNGCHQPPVCMCEHVPTS